MSAESIANAGAETADDSISFEELVALRAAKHSETPAAEEPAEEEIETEEETEETEESEEETE